MSNEMFNMVKAVVGVGVLSLPAGKCMDIVVVWGYNEEAGTLCLLTL